MMAALGSTPGRCWHRRTTRCRQGREEFVAIAAADGSQGGSGGGSNVRNMTGTRRHDLDLRGGLATRLTSGTFSYELTVDCVQNQKQID
jgi:hypothetical protein